MVEASMAEASNAPSSSSPMTNGKRPLSSSSRPRDSRATEELSRPTPSLEEARYGAGNGNKPRLTPLRRPTQQSVEPRQRRVQSVGDSSLPGLSGSPRSKRMQLPNTFIAPSSGTPSEKSAENVSFTMVSDEYDLSQEDPSIMQDVQRALKMKSRREARLRGSLSSASTRPDPAGPSNARLPARAGSRPTPAATFHYRSVSGPTSINTELDFSPSTGQDKDELALHPVPSLAKDGVTIDWSGNDEDERGDRRWSLSGGKRKSREKASIPPKAVLQQQDKVHANKLQRLRGLASPHAARKASITATQLERRYAFLNNTSTNGYTLLEAARWLSQQERVVRSSLEVAEPFTWLKHFEKKDTLNKERSPWHLSAFIMEEYAVNRQNMAQATLAAAVGSPDSANEDDSPDFSSTDMTSNAQFSPVVASPPTSFGPSLSRHKRNDGRISFEPIVNSSSPRRSIEDTSRKSVESYSTIFSGSSNPTSGYHNHNGMNRSPSATRVFPRAKDKELSTKLHNQRLHLEESDDGSSIERLLGPDTSPQGKGRQQTQSAASSWQGASLQDGNGNGSSAHSATEENAAQDVDPSGPPTAKPNQRFVIDRSPRLRSRTGRSLKLSEEARLSTIMEQRRHQEEEEIRIDHEYEFKAQLLINTQQRHADVRGTLYRISNLVRQYDQAQGSLSEILGLEYKALPAELLESFSHDPSHVLGHTRRLIGYAAVDDIHERLLRQRKVFSDFLHENADHGEILMKDGTDALQDPIQNIFTALERLERAKTRVSTRVELVGSRLKDVQKTQRLVKDEYNDAIAHTSSAYPELSQIAVLEETYKDQYQHFWEFGVDALTFLLDTVTPFWRNYGKTIGQDVQDFLIIPVFRNEFTGEPKFYPILHLPRRSFRHWCALVFWFLGTIAGCVLQTKGAIASSKNYKLECIPFEGLRWVMVPLFFCSIMAQWVAVVIGYGILLTEIMASFWWLGWTVGLAK